MIDVIFKSHFTIVIERSESNPFFSIKVVITDEKKSKKYANINNNLFLSFESIRHLWTTIDLVESIDRVEKLSLYAYLSDFFMYYNCNYDGFPESHRLIQCIKFIKSIFIVDGLFIKDLPFDDCIYMMSCSEIYLLPYLLKIVAYSEYDLDDNQIYVADLIQTIILSERMDKKLSTIMCAFCFKKNILKKELISF